MADDSNDEPKTLGEAFLGAEGAIGSTGGAAVYEVPVEVTAILGTSEMKVSQLLKMGRGAVVQLDRTVGEAVDIHANNQLIAKGEVVVVEEHLAVTMTEIIKSHHNK